VCLAPGWLLIAHSNGPNLPGRKLVVSEMCTFQTLPASSSTLTENSSMPHT
jgi:hypothetical protein